MNNKTEKKVSFTEALIILMMIFSLIACLFPTRAFAGSTGSAISFGITNNTIAASAGSTTLGASVAVIDQQDFVTLYFTAGSIATNAANVQIILAPTDADGNVFTNTPINWLMAQIVGTPGTPTTNNIVYSTNLDRSVIGANYGLTVLTVSNQSAAGALQSPTLKYAKKRLQAPN